MKKIQNRCTRHGKVGRDLGFFGEEFCRSCRLLSLCESKAGKSLDQAIAQLEAEQEAVNEASFQEYMEQRQELDEEIKTLFVVEEIIKKMLVSAFHELVDLCQDYGFDDDADFEEMFEELRAKSKLEEAAKQRMSQQETRLEAMQTQYELDQSWLGHAPQGA